jgi:hypothetical protein
LANPDEEGARIVQRQAMMLIILSLVPRSSPGILSAWPLALFYDFAQIRKRAYLNRSKSIPKAWQLWDIPSRGISFLLGS